MISTMLTLSRKSFVISLVLPLAIFAATEAIYAAAMLLHAGTTFLLLPVVLPLVMFIYISLNSMNVTMQNYALAVHMSRTRSESITAVFISQLIMSLLSLTLSLALTLFDQLITLKVWLVISPSLDVSGFLGNVMPWLFAAAAIAAPVLGTCLAALCLRFGGGALGLMWLGFMALVMARDNLAALYSAFPAASIAVIAVAALWLIVWSARYFARASV